MLSVAVVSSPLQERHGQSHYRRTELLERESEKRDKLVFFPKINWHAEAGQSAEDKHDAYMTAQLTLTVSVWPQITYSVPEPTHTIPLTHMHSKHRTTKRLIGTRGFTESRKLEYVSLTFFAFYNAFHFYSAFMNFIKPFNLDLWVQTPLFCTCTACLKFVFFDI